MTLTLTDALQDSDMLLIDDLHAFDFHHDAAGLRIECMVGRDRKRWQFSAAQVAAARLNIDLQQWAISDETATHQLTCVQAFSGRNEDETEQES